MRSTIPACGAQNPGFEFHAFDHHQHGAGRDRIAGGDLHRHHDARHRRAGDVVTGFVAGAGKRHQRIDIAHGIGAAAALDVNHIAVHHIGHTLALAVHDQAPLPRTLFDERHRSAPPVRDLQVIACRRAGQPDRVGFTVEIESVMHLSFSSFRERRGEAAPRRPHRAPDASAARPTPAAGSRPLRRGRRPERCRDSRRGSQCGPLRL